MGVCSKCGNVPRAGQSYCNACHAEYMRIHRPKHIELLPEPKKRANCRSYANVYSKRGMIVKKYECESCGGPNPEKHHPDYDKPLEVQWLCRKCHLDLHNGIRKIETEAE